MPRTKNQSAAACGAADDKIASQESRLVEYCWPLDNGGDFYLLENHVQQYLEIGCLETKFPEIERRAVTNDERKFIKEKGILTGVRARTKLFALKTEDVCDMMAEKFPHKYQRYLQMVHEKERKKIMDDQHAQMSAKNIGKILLNAKKAIKDAAEYNLHLNQDRKEERSSYFDMQTQGFHHQVLVPKENFLEAL
eukprot:gene17492-19241_t